MKNPRFPILLKVAIFLVVLVMPATTVGLNSVPLTGVVKNLYLHDASVMSRRVPVSDQSELLMVEDQSEIWVLNPALQKPLNLDASGPEISVRLLLRKLVGSNHNLTITISGSVSGVIAVEAFQNLKLKNAYQVEIFDVDIVDSLPITLASGETIILTVRHDSGTGLRRLAVKPSDGSNHSRVELPSNSAINIENIQIFNASYPGGTEVTSANPGDVIYIRAMVSDPFGSADITSAELDLKDAGESPIVSGVAMMQVTSPPYPTGSEKLFETQVTLPNPVTAGTWVISVTAKEGSEATVEHIATHSFQMSSEGSSPSIHHFLIEHDGSGSTCDYESITVKACADAACLVLSTNSTTVDFQGNGTTVSSPTFTGSSTFNFSHSTAETLTLSVTNSNVTPTNPLVCDSGVGSSCDIVFSSSCVNSCSSFFSDTAQGHSGASELVFKSKGKIIDDPDNLLTFQNLSDQTAAVHNTCSTMDCSISGSIAPALALRAFETTTTTTDVLESGGLSTIGPGGTYNITEIDQLTVSGDAHVTFLPSAAIYKIRSGQFTGNAQVTFNAGEYWFDFLAILETTQIFINGQVTIYVNQHFDVEGASQINAGGAARNLAIVSYDMLHLKGAAVVNAAIYAAGSEIRLQNDVKMTGSISANGKVEIKNTASLTYENVSGVKIGSLCGALVARVDHYEIIHDGAGLTCEAESITIKACEDSACTTLSSDPISLDFQADGITKSSPTITGSAVVSLSQTSASTLTLSVARPSIMPSGSLVCSGDSCDIVFSTAGFRFLYGASNSTTIANQLAGSGFGDSLKIQAVKDVSGVCTGLFDGSVNIDLAQQSISPGNVSALDFTVNGSAIAKNPSSGVTSYTSTTLNFGSDSIATIPTPFYQDAGQIQLHADYDVGGITLTGNSNSFWVSPDRLTVTARSVATDLDATTATGFPVHKAGASFDFVVTAINATGTTTPNYKPTQIQLKLLRTGPSSGGVEGGFFYGIGSSMTSALAPVYQNVTLESFVSGISTFNQASYSEVGLLNLDLMDSNYGGVGIIVPGDAIDMGRFIPDHFRLSVSGNGSFQPSCTSGPADFTYIGEDFSYLVAPVVTISPVVASGIGVTQNYRGSFMHLTAGEISLKFPVIDGGNSLVVVATPDPGSLNENGNGTLNYTFSLLDRYVYSRVGATEAPPFVGDLSIQIANVFETLDSVSAEAMPLAVSPSGMELRFGRLSAGNAFGSEIEDLPVPVVTEYFSASGRYETNSDDFCSDPISLLSSLPDSVPSASHANIPVGGGSSTISFDNPVIAGDLGFVFSAPGEANIGDINLTFDLGSRLWLQYDWGGDGSLDASLVRTVTFGQYRGHDRVIYWQEVLP